MGLFTNYKARSDRELMIFIQNGDHRAFEKLYERYANRLNAFFYKMLWTDTAMAEDHVHDLFAKIIDKPELYKSEYDVKPWLFRMASNMCKNAYRKKSFEDTYRRQLEEQEIYISEIEFKIDERIQSDRLDKALAQLDEEKRTLFLLRFQQELSIYELSEIFDLPEGTIKSRIFHIKKQLLVAVEDNLNV